MVSNVATKRRRWVAAIRSDLDALVAARASHERARRIVEEREPALVAYLDEVRSQMVALGIRRQLKTDSRSVTLAGLVADLVARPDGGEPLATVLSRAERGFGGPSDVLREELRALKTRAQSAEAYADRTLAHADRRSPPVPSHADLETLLDEVVDLFRRVEALVQGRAPADRSSAV